MIGRLASPLVCVVDDDPDEYGPILSALNGLGVSALHYSGQDVGELPAVPHESLRLVFMDLHLMGDTGANAASRAASVFQRIVSPKSGPLVVVIWSRFADVEVDHDAEEESKTEATVFTETLVGDEPAYAGRVVFTTMPKPTGDKRPDEWVPALQEEIKKSVADKQALDFLWGWESIVREVGRHVSAELTDLAMGGPGSLEDGLRTTLQMLASAEGGVSMTDVSAVDHAYAALGHLAVDQLEHAADREGLEVHGSWLCEDAQGGVSGAVLNKLLLSGEFTNRGAFAPGSVFRLSQNAPLETLIGVDRAALIRACAQHPENEGWEESAMAVAVELSPVCDVAQGKRSTAMLVGGVIAPDRLRKNAKQTGAWMMIGAFRVRSLPHGMADEDCILVLSSRHKLTLPCEEVPDWLQGWFRLREIPTTAIRNWFSAQTARVGYASIQ